MKRRPYWIFYPEYFDKDRTRGEGRRVPRALAVERPTLEELAKACKMLGLEYILEKEKRYPKNWYYSQGRIAVKRIDGKKKKELLRELAKCLLLVRQQ